MFRRRSIADWLSAGKRVPVPRLPEFELPRFLGEWYEIARIDTWFERGLSHVRAFYEASGDGELRIINRGLHDKSGRWKERRARAVPDGAPNFLKVYFVPFVAGRYRVACVDTEYRRALVSGGSLRYAWVLARTPSLTDEELVPFLRMAEELGYDPRRFLRTRQGGES